MTLKNLVTLQDDCTFLAASLIETIACGWHVVRFARKALDNKAPEEARAFVLGGVAIGGHFAMCLQAQGIPSVTLLEFHDFRRTYLAEMLPITVLYFDRLAEIKPHEMEIDGVCFN